MNLSLEILGTSIVRSLTESASSAVLHIGADRLTRADLARVGCFNFSAARILSRVLDENLGVKNLRQVFDEVAPRDLVLPGLGAVSLAVLGAAFEAKGIGGAAPLDAYVRKHEARVATFATLKGRARKLERAQQTRKRRRA